MPSLHYLNPPPNPFWDFVASLDDHPFLAAYAPRDEQGAREQGTSQPEASGTGQPSEKAQGKQPAADDPPEVDPSTVRPQEARDMPYRGRGRHCGPAGDAGEGRRGCHGRGGPWGRQGNPFVFGGPGATPFGASSMFGPPPSWRGLRHRGHPHHGRHSDRQNRENVPEQGQQEHRGFNLGEFLNNLGERLGVDLSSAAENFGVDGNKYSAPRNSEADFEPRADIFDTPASYVIHLSLPGAKKSDVGVDWDGEHSILRITGVVHRPDADEAMLKQLVVDGRKRENGVFEKAIRLGTKRDPASVDVAAITAKMSDGVLVVKVPKVEKEHSKREVPISGAAETVPRSEEKDLLFDAEDQEMYDASEKFQSNENIDTPREHPVTAHTTADEQTEEARDDRSVTAGRDEEQLPRYEVEAGDQHNEMSDWEKDSEEEADYVKINVD
jgi:HSP20 family protein